MKFLLAVLSAIVGMAGAVFYGGLPAVMFCVVGLGVGLALLTLLVMDMNSDLNADENMLWALTRDVFDAKRRINILEMELERLREKETL